MRLIAYSKLFPNNTNTISKEIKVFSIYNGRDYFNKHLNKALMFTLRNKMEWMNEKIDTFLKLLGHYCFKVRHPSIFGVNVFPNNKLSCTLPLKTFGCIVFIHIHEPNQGKLEPRKGIRSCTKHLISNFISYDKLSPAYSFYL
ncbi:hypothetical protein CR513_43190, partial [Mucuna pruriens]